MEYPQMEQYLKAIGDHNRMLILKYLMKDALCICEFTELLDMTQPAVSQHMRKLKQAELVIEEKRGRWTIWSLNTKHLQYPILLHLLSLLPEPERTIESLAAEGKRVVCE
ncbi:metalloregulator ArsR/SmtB family transcription factor [Planococcus sp. N028]|uniref:Metalloregulator ArsR/SmtB family transcription factor n=1 Tax=Planococcus shixiaomingii TaxID=3058393 RepID=A0ABT8N616_9BACL|nr:MULTISPECIES: metalloregulator ArsR/SmtB family transcription factor [unclassified Planococcus (in: firmicutes)]MDN7243328.1 metalloregulator ArsR/SmtB family transcription factor [Planococcus sp. N028]WKA55270.1 metalloregulator ArsR/SmtB family transcription factor [Planococcus sp. N022]